MTKDELIQENEKLNGQIEGLEKQIRALKETIEEKGFEYAKLDVKAGELEKKIAEQKHLASAVEAKDNEISALTNKIEIMQKELDDAALKISTQKHLADAVEAKDGEIIKSKNEFDARLKTEIDRVTKIHEETEKKQTETIQFLGGEEQRRVDELNRLILQHGNLLKSIQGTVDNAIALNDFMVEEIQKQK